MQGRKCASLLLAGLLQLAPFTARTLELGSAVANAPAAFVLKWAAGALAVAGTYHAVSAASAALVSPSTIQGTVGTRLSYHIKISDGNRRLPESWLIGGQEFAARGATTLSLPPGISLSLATGIISGIPTQAGDFPVPISAFEHANLTGAELDFTLTFNILGGTASAPAVSIQPSEATLHPGETLSLAATATGTGPLTYQWQHGTTNLTGQTSADLSITAVSAENAGQYQAVVTGSGGSATSSPVTVTIIPLSIEMLQVTAEGATITLATIPGRQYNVQAADTATASAWQTLQTITALDNTTQFIDPQVNNARRFWRYFPAP
jgi:hypothetical protein